MPASRLCGDTSYHGSTARFNRLLACITLWQRHNLPNSGSICSAVSGAFQQQAFSTDFCGFKAWRIPCGVLIEI
uniref:hypothetical protein n=1 Tax=Vibrio cholerae TaxID=666 RepID=UPI003F58E64F